MKYVFPLHYTRLCIQGSKDETKKEEKRTEYEFHERFSFRSVMFVIGNSPLDKLKVFGVHTPNTECLHKHSFFSR